MDDTSPELREDAKAKTIFDAELYARLYALDPQLAHLMNLWPMLSIDDRRALTEQAEQLLLVTKETK